jgi:DNA-binding transcriptional ArsR family regulator
MENPEKILLILADEQNRKIIQLLSNEELTIRQVSKLQNIPQSTAYRKIKKLEELKIIKKTKVVRTLDGIDESYYKNWTFEINVKFKDGKISYSLEHLDMADKIVRLWQKFSE